MFYFLLAMVILLPLSMAIVGIKYVKNPPEKINDLHGFRTELSMKNKKMWDFAQRFFGNLWFAVGVALSPVSIAFYLLFSNDFYTASIVLISIQLIIMLATLPIVQSRLKKL